MMQRTKLAKFAFTRALLSGGGPGTPSPWQDKEYPNMPHDVSLQHGWGTDVAKNPLLNKLLDQNNPMYDVVVGAGRVYWQEPARVWWNTEADDTLIMQEHDKEEWNDKPYVGVSHLYEPPLGTEERPCRLEVLGNPGDATAVACFGSCAPHVPMGTYFMMMRGYQTTKCPMCQQWYYIHNRPWLVMHPDWTDEPAADEGPAFTFAEIESEFDRDFHEFAVYLNAE
eukprot:88288_1